MIACLSVNDDFVMWAWGESKNADAISMRGDGGAAFTQALGLEVSTGKFATEPFQSPFLVHSIIQVF